MVKVNILPFRVGKKQRCSLCNRQKMISRLALFHEDGTVCGDLLLCDDCTEVLEDALLHGSCFEELGLQAP